MRGIVVAHTLQRCSLHGGGLGFEPCGLPKINFVKQQGATWQPMPGPRGTLQLAERLPHVQPKFDIQLTNQHFPHHHMPCHHMVIHVRIRSLPRHLYGLYSKQIFACLENRTERDISLI
jgi:hypothetical protein